ncbi:replication initiator protein RctB domain-containing protein, partial [Vibrio harveyi]|uniref:replication initiator protein RctB domain-containing protein n=1 Tax=Vibrio harveyi TaxID=669 RepID=UPI0018F2319F
DLIRELRKLADDKVSDDVFAVNLWGYHLTISPLENDKRYCDYQIDIRCDADEVIRYSRAKTTNEGKRTMAPTMPNPLRNEILPKRELDQLSQIIDGEFEPIQRKEGRTKGRLGRRVKLRKHLVEINADELTIILSKYTSPEALQRSITALSAMTGHSASSVSEECHELLEKLDWLRVADQVVSYETLSKT